MEKRNQQVNNLLNLFRVSRSHLKALTEHLCHCTLQRKLHAEIKVVVFGFFVGFQSVCNVSTSLKLFFHTKC